ncbi:MAG: ATP-binding protein [Vitreoscilla sp.]|nr:ATP-binding protein [Vitreoscilla sp.]
MGRDVSTAWSSQARDLEAELEWLARVWQWRLHDYFDPQARGGPWPVARLAPPDLATSDSAYASLLRRHGLGPDDRLLIALALAPHLRPQLLDVLLARNETTGRGFTEFGGLPGASGGFLPTAETACFLLAGDHLHERLRAAHRLEDDQPLARHDLVHREPLPAAPERPREPAGAAPLQASASLLRQVLHASTEGAGHALPVFEAGFPARRVETGLAWADLVLPAATLAQLEEIHHWTLHRRTLLVDWGLGTRLKPGFTSLFHGPPGTGKTLSACLLGQRCGQPVLRVDLAAVVSKYIGETEKNLARLFDQAEHQGWILFFDEADALFGKRSRVTDSHDRYANQEVSYLLQRIEDFDGVVILASNLKSNLDEAFLRRFQSVVGFAMPRPNERLRLWREALPAVLTPERGVDLHRLAEKHEISGGTILNAVRHACLCSAARGDLTLRAEDLDEGVRRELHKEGRAL